ncbi:hypothetical protein [Methanobrevibacter sp.]|uniref:hypothetical protein n=1 Tax=Methanobrevibacter sp. TaxID=66852 RepID=UPI00388F6D60
MDVVTNPLAWRHNLMWSILSIIMQYTIGCEIPVRFYFNYLRLLVGLATGFAF